MLIKNFFYLIIPLFVISACKKGEEDPFISLSSRKARLTGDWEMKNISSERRSMIGSATFESTSIITGDETKFSRVITNSQGTLSADHVIIDYSIQINKDGTWKKVIETNKTEVDDGYYGPPNLPFKEIKRVRVKSTVSGTWGFINKTKGTYKNKERVYLSTLKTTYQSLGGTKTTEFDDPDKETIVLEISPKTKITTHTYAQGEETTVYDIVMLKSKEMKWSRENEHEKNSFSNETTVLEPFSSLTETITWKAKK